MILPPIPALEPWQWGLAALAAFCIGVGKTGVAGVGTVSVALFPSVLPAKSAVGIALLVLICADLVAITAYPRRMVRWDIWRGVFGWAILGVAIGAVVACLLTDASAVRRVIGAILLVMVGLQTWVRLRSSPLTNPLSEERGEGVEGEKLTGVATGIATMLANAAGPIMVLYLLPRRLPKETFVATTAWFFFALNLFKLPFSAGAGMMDAASPLIAACLLPAAVVGGLAGKWLLPRIEQKTFETASLVLTGLAAARLLLG